MFRFEHPDYTFALLIIPALTLFFSLARLKRRQALLRFGDPALTARLMPLVSNLKHPLKFGMLAMVLTLLIVAWANPQWGNKKEKVQQRSSDVVIALDVSNSMLCEDVKPNRLERAKAFAVDLIKSLKGDRIGSIVFAGNAYVQMPLTTDYAAAALFMSASNPDQVPTQGTALAEAIDLADTEFSPDHQQQKVLIIITDGEDHDGGAIDRATKAVENNMVIFTVGVGTPQGGLIPTHFQGATDYKRDEKGEPVRTVMNEQMMKDLAGAGAGAYFNLSNTTGIIPALKARIDKIEKKEVEERLFNVYESYFQYFVAIALLILLLEFMTPYRRSSWLEDKDIFKV